MKITVKKAETKEIFQKEAREFVINRKSHTLHRKNKCNCNMFFARYVDFDSVEDAINDYDDFNPCKTCFSQANFPIQADNNSAKDVCNQAVKALYLRQYDVAQRLFERFLQLEPAQPLGYVGLARVEAVDDNAVINKYCDMMKPAFQMTCAPVYQSAMRKVVNYRSEGLGITLLATATSTGNLDTVRFLVRMGADVNRKSPAHTTALWHVACRPLKSKAEEKREIAKLLLENGASVDVCSKYCVSLYNKYTDPKIAAMIRQKYPNAEMGFYPNLPDDEIPTNSTRSSQPKPTKRSERTKLIDKILALPSQTLAIIITIVIVLILTLVIALTSANNSGDRKWSDLSDDEKENAKWADSVMDSLENQRRQY